MTTATPTKPKSLTPELLASATGCTRANAEKWAELLSEVMRDNDISTNQRKAFFLAQLAHESGRFDCVSENLNYSASALLAVFRKYFTHMEAQDYARQPQRIASRVYANRMGNGDEASGDGWTYRGKGLIQITGKDNHALCGDALGIDLVRTPSLLTDPRYAAASAGWFWTVRGLNAVADKGDFDLATRRINGGLNGIDDRRELLKRAKAALG